MPSGATQLYEQIVGVSTIHRYENSATQGRLKLYLTWYDRDGGSTQTTTTIELPASSQLYGAYQTNGNFWRQLRRVESSIIVPESLGEKSDLRQWSRHSHVLAELYHVGGVRVVDAVLTEIPFGLALEANDSGGYWVGHNLATTAGGTSYTQLTWPYDRIDDAGSDGDPRGTQHLLDVHHAQWDRLGPALIAWNAHAETTPAVGAQGGYTGTFGSDGSNSTYTEAYQFLAASATANTWYRWPDGEAVSYDTTQPGWSISSAAYSRRISENDGMPYNGSVPVIVRVRAATSTGGTSGGFRVQASAYSNVEVSLPSLTTTPAWFTTYGHLRCGAGPGDPSIVQAFARRTAGTGSVRIYSFSVHRAGAWAPAST